jgi:hypothetical protein
LASQQAAPQFEERRRAFAAPLLRLDKPEVAKAAAP